MLLWDENNYIRDAEVTAIGENQLKDSNEINVRRMHIFFPMMIELDAQLLDPLPDQTRYQPVAVGSEFPCMFMYYVLYKLRNANLNP